MKIRNLFFAFSIILALSSCSVQPEPIIFGNDPCVSCKMIIADPKYGAELVTDKGRVYKFDAIECMIPYLKQNTSTKFSFIMAVAYDDPEKLKNVEDVYFVKNEHFKSPMGENLAAFDNQPTEFDSLNWEQLKNTFR